MASTLSVTFHGLCLLAKRSNQQYDVLCHPEPSAHPHTPVLSIRIDDVQIAHPDMTWQPTFVGHDANGHEIGFWDLRGEVFSLGTAATQVFQGGPDAVRLSALHGGTAKPVSDADARKVILPSSGHKGAIVSILGGKIAYKAPPNVSVIIKKGSGNPEPAKFVASAVTWEGALSAQPTNQAGQKLMLETDNRFIPINITNVNRQHEPDGLTHFHHYYQLISGIAIGDRVQLFPGQGDINVYDCVPPTDVP